MALIVYPSVQNSTQGTVSIDGHRYACALGRAGISTNKIEGDGATPVGTFPLREIYYRADRVVVPSTHLKTRPLEPDDGWCDSPTDPHYNKHVRHPYRASAEALWRDERVYDVIVVIGYNDAPVQPGKGSAIFMHVAKDGYTPTEGCVALALPDLLAVIKALPDQPTITIQK